MGTPIWSLDGKKIAFASYQKISIYDLQLDQLQVAYQTTGDANPIDVETPWELHWSPDSQQIAFIGRETLEHEGTLISKRALYIITLSNLDLKIISVPSVNLIQWRINHSFVVENVDVPNAPVITILSNNDK
jgi:Tol biopolymer transport system component